MHDLRVNGKPLEPIPYARDHVVVPREHLRPGANRVEVAFAAPVRPAGAALTRYRDGTDGSEYIYSLLVPADASTLFPCFDQPDLKARFTLELTVPEQWRAVSNGRELARAELADAAHYRFAPTEPISTYLLAFAAGPFAELRDSHSDLRLLVRRSRLERAREEAGEIFRLHREGLRWLERYFAQPYAYGKLDVVLVPEFAYGGMEHAGAIFLREDSVLFPFEPSDADRLRRAQLIFHEAAHQWFGDLVTMRWFDDLWLKEGFANLMAAKAAAALMPEYAPWNAFRALKTAAYRTDETRGTTPIWQALPNLNAAKSAYGSIVYSKAPAILRQLEFYLGEDVFAAGVRTFLAQHAHGAADWGDLLAAFEAASGEPLQEWARAWVTGAGVPRVTQDWQRDGAGRVARLELAQAQPLRPLRSQLLLAYEDGTRSRSPAAPGRGAECSGPRAEGRPAPLFAYANYGDYGYGLFLLDPASGRHLLAHLGEVQDGLLRALLWDALWEEVRETRITPSEWLALALRELPGEQDDVTVSGVLARLQTALPLVSERRAARGPCASARGGPAAGHAGRTDPQPAHPLLPRLRCGRRQRERPHRNETAAHRRDRWCRRFDCPPAIATASCAAWWPCPTPTPSSFSQPKRSATPATTHVDSPMLRARPGRMPQPSSATSMRSCINRDLPERWIEEALPAFNAVEQQDATRAHLQAALAALPELSSRHKIFFVNAWLSAFVGGQADAQALALAEQAAADPALAPDLKRKLLEVTDELARTVAIRRAAGNP